MLSRGASRGAFRGTPVAASGNATILTYLSLFLLLLVFFIVLNAHSTPRDYRVRAVLGSVERTFPVTESARARAGAAVQGGAAVAALAGLKRLGELFETELAIVKIDQVSQGGVMVATMPADEVFEQGSAFIRRERMGLLDRISRQIGDQEGVRFEAEFLIAVGGEPAGRGELGDPVARGAAMARTLIADRAPPDAISVGVEPGEEGTVRFLFSARAPGAAGGGRATP